MRKKILLTLAVLVVGLSAACGTAKETPNPDTNQVEDSKGNEESKPTTNPKADEATEPTKAPTPTPKADEPTGTSTPTPTNTPVPTPTNTPIPTNTPTPTPSPTPAPLLSYMEEGNGIWITGLLDRSVNNLVIPETLDGKTVTGITAYAFQNNNTLQSIEIPATMTTIPDNAFSGCSSLQKLVIAEGNTVYTSKAADGTECNVVLRIADGALLNGCNTSVIPEGTITIEAMAFAGSNIETVVLPKSVVTVKSNAFNACPSLKKLVIEGDTTLDAHSFALCEALEEVIANGSVTANEKVFWARMYEKKYAVKKVTVAEGYETLVKAVEETITNLTLADGVQKITYNSIWCPELKEISIPASVLLVAPGAFNCPKLEKITVADGNEYYTTKTESGTDCNGLLDKETNKLLLGCCNTVLSEEMTGVASYAFCGTKFAELIIPNGIQIDENAFYSYGSGSGNYMEFVKLTVPYDLINSIGTNNIKELILTGDKEKLQGTQCRNFQLWKTLKKITLPEGITSIENEAFTFDYALEEVVFPEGMEKLSYGLFGYCSELKKVVIPSTVTQIDPCVFMGCSSLKEVILPEGITRIEGGTFSGCSALTSVYIPNSVTYIENNAFQGCSGLTEVEIPASVTEIREEAFSGCTNLTFIKTPADSYAATWAKEHGYRVKTME